LYVEYPIVCTSVRREAESGQVVEIFCRYQNEGPIVKPKAYIQWVAQHSPSGSPLTIHEARLFRPLFTCANPAGSDDFIADLNPESLQVAKGAMTEIGFWDVATQGLQAAREEAERRKPGTTAKPADTTCPSSSNVDSTGYECVRFQGLRVAYFCVDKDSRIQAVEEGRVQLGYTKGDFIVLNTIVSLKEDTGKK